MRAGLDLIVLKLKWILIFKKVNKVNCHSRAKSNGVHRHTRDPRRTVQIKEKTNLHTDGSRCLITFHVFGNRETPRGIKTIKKISCSPFLHGYGTRYDLCSRAKLCTSTAFRFFSALFRTLSTMIFCWSWRLILVWLSTNQLWPKS